MARFHVRRRVEFCETDAAGIAHFSAFFQYMEQAEHALLRSLGMSVVMEDAEGTLSWPRVHASCDYAGSVRFEDELDVFVSIARLGTKSVTYLFDFQIGDTMIASGKIIVVCCRIVHGRPPQPVAIPGWMAEQLQEFCDNPGTC